MGKPFGGRAIPQKGAIIGAGAGWVKAVIPAANQRVNRAWPIKNGRSHITAANERGGRRSAGGKDYSALGERSRITHWLAITSTSDSSSKMVASALTSGETPTFTIE